MGVGTEKLHEHYEAIAKGGGKFFCQVIPAKHQR